MNTCGTCKHFGSVIEGWDEEKEDYLPTAFHRCNLLNLRRKERKIPPPLAYAQDGSDYQASLCVKAEFGCAEWAPQDSPVNRPAEPSTPQSVGDGMTDAQREEMNRALRR